MYLINFEINESDYSAVNYKEKIITLYTTMSKEKRN